MRIIAIANWKLSKAIFPTQAYRSIYYHAIYQYRLIYHAFFTLPLHLPSGFCLNVYTTYSYLWSAMLIDIWLQWEDFMHVNCLTLKLLGVIFISPGDIFFNTLQVFLNHPHTGIEISITSYWVVSSAARYHDKYHCARYVLQTIRFQWVNDIIMFKNN